MGLPHITSFCCCMGLEMGSKVVGVTHLLASLVMVLLCSVFAGQARSYIGTVEDSEDYLYTHWFNIALGVTLVSVVHVLLAITLLLAVFKRNISAVRAYVLIMCALYVAALVCVVASMAVYGSRGTGSDIFLAFLEGVLFFGLLAYCILCVNSYYLVLKSHEDMQGPNKSDY